MLRILADGPTYGYNIAARLTDAGFADVKGGTLYPLLKRLEGTGLVDVEWRPGEAGPGRKFYLINTAGSQRLMALTASWQCYSATVTRLLDEGSAS
ncbi:transcriptional regulator, PadR family [Cutibacterium acnes HL042PA3]|nr:transcriptional regulator, PadR family [Cutibacterium acnes HL042PA3]